MCIFLDTSDVDEVQRFHGMGLIRGVTTNPTIMLKDQGACGLDTIREQVISIADLIHPYPVSIEVFSNEKEEMLRQARDFAAWRENIIIKIPFHGPNGEYDNIEVIHELEGKHDVRVNATAMMSAQQCLLAALAGASYVSIFCGRINNMGYESQQELEKTRKMIDTSDHKSKIIAASIREVINIIEWLMAGAHIVTVTPAILYKMIVHPYTKETVAMFLSDAEKLTKIL